MTWRYDHATAPSSRRMTVAVLMALCLVGHADEPVGPAATGADWPARFGFGTPVSAGEIADWDIDVAPDGAGLPSGRGTARLGAPIYAEKCAACHGPTGVEGPNDRLVAAEGEAFPSAAGAASARHRTIGTYWPYATTVFDYLRRAMPLNQPGSLSADEVYALTAYLLFRNGIVTDTTVIDARSLSGVRMPARDRFVPDDRLDYREVH